SDAFMVEKIYLCGITPKPPHRDIQKTALGATESVDWWYVQNTLDAVIDLKSKGYKVYAVEQAQGSISLEKFSGMNWELDPKYVVFSPPTGRKSQIEISKKS
ncbi:MAG: hypothetical protein EBY07_13660, partial [Actinobacteria bacterium]|nr:hypothetical protein [Actinomycetota bacterium]